MNIRQSFEFCLAIFAFSMFVPAYSQSTFTYELAGVGTDDGNCQLEADAIAHRLNLVTHKTIVNSGCERSLPWRQNIVIQYESDFPLQLVSTFDEFAMAQGRFEDREACEKNLEAEKSLFFAKTGLEPVAFFCFSQSASQSKNQRSWVSRVDGFGSPRLKPFVFDGIFFGTPNRQPSLLKSSVMQSLTTMPGIESPRIALDLSTSPASLRVAYYGSTDRALVLNEFANFDKIDSCERDRDHLDHVLRDFGVKGLSSFCTLNSVTMQTRYYFFGVATEAYAIERVRKSFPDRDHCLAAMNEEVDRRKSRAGSAHVAGFCSFENTEFMGTPAYFVKLIISQ